MFKIFKKNDKNQKGDNLDDFMAKSKQNKLNTPHSNKAQQEKRAIGNSTPKPQEASQTHNKVDTAIESLEVQIEQKSPNITTGITPKTINQSLQPEIQKTAIPTTTPLQQPIEESTENPIVNDKLDDKLERSRNGFGKKMKNLFSFSKTIDDDLFEDIETTLLMADVGAKATLEIVDKTAKSVKRLKLGDAQAVQEALKTHLQELAQTVEKPLIIDSSKKPYVILVVGVNGVGKTTTIAKIARKLKLEGKSVMLAAGDTFRAAAVDQLKTWGHREGIPVVAQTTGSDSASVIFDAISSAKAKGIDVLIADTAGRLHTQANLMQELGKIGRVMRKNDETAPHETLIVVDGGTGQNAISQIGEFNKTTKLTGIVITKLDGTAKGGVLFNLAKEFAIPIRYIGVGERASDLKPFVAKEFVDALLG